MESKSLKLNPSVPLKLHADQREKKKRIKLETSWQYGERMCSPFNSVMLTALQRENHYSFISLIRKWKPEDLLQCLVKSSFLKG